MNEENRSSWGTAEAMREFNSAKDKGGFDSAEARSGENTAGAKIDEENRGAAVSSTAPKKEAWEYFKDGGSGTSQKPVPEKKKNKMPGYVCAIIACILLIVGLFTVLVGQNTSALETGEPIDVYYATETDQYVYGLVQYMTEAVAYYDAMENQQFYIVLDKDWNPAVLCLHTDELPAYQPYIDWLYSESYENEPEQMMVTGYAQPYDEGLIDLVLEGFVYTFGEDTIDKNNFTDYFGEYYLQVGQANGAYHISNTGIYLLLAAVILFVIGGAILYEKPAPVPENGPIIPESKRGRGILGAFLGACLGGLAWAVIGALGIISGWIGILIVFFSFKGYAIFSHKEDKFGKVISMIFGLLMMLPATYLGYGWNYYRAINENLTGYTTLARALLEMPAYMTTYDIWGDFVRDIAIGYLCMFVAGMYMLVGNFSAKNRNKLGRESQKTGNKI